MSAKIKDSYVFEFIDTNDEITYIVQVEKEDNLITALCSAILEAEKIHNSECKEEFEQTFQSCRLLSRSIITV